MIRGPSPWPSGAQREGTSPVRGVGHHLTVCKIFFFGGLGTTQGGLESFRQPVIPPAPLTGDVGRDCGDASRALLLAAEASAGRLVEVEAKSKSGAHPGRRGFWGRTAVSRSRHPRGPGGGITVGEQGLAGYGRDHCGVEWLGNQERRLGALARQEAL